MKNLKSDFKLKKESKSKRKILIYLFLLTTIIGLYIYPTLPLNAVYKELINYKDKTAIVEEVPVIRVINEVKAEEVILVDDYSTEEVEQMIREIARENNFKYPSYLIRLAYCENDTLNPNRRGDVDKRDRGIFQINSHWHSEVSDECAFDIRCATEWTMWRINTGWQHEWMCDDLIKGKTLEQVKNRDY
jgi:hypothetical protein